VRRGPGAVKRRRVDRQGRISHDAAPMRPTELSRTASVLWTLASGATVFGALGAYEALSLSTSPSDATSGARFGAVALALLVGLTSAVFHAAALIGLRRGPLVTPTVDDAAAEASSAATVCARLLSLPIIAAAAFVGGYLAHGFVQRTFAGPFTALAALAGWTAAEYFVPTLRAACRAAVVRLCPTARVLGIRLSYFIVLVAVMGVAIVGVVALSRLDLGAWRLGGWVVVALGTFATPIVALATERWAAPARRAAAGCVVGAVIAALSGAVSLARSGEASAALMESGGLSGIAVGALRRLTDSDGDGISDRFGGGDCDDGNAEIFPGAREVPGNGVDDNCVDGDAPPPTEPPTPTSAPAAFPPSATQRGRPLNVVLLAIDTLRPDHLSFSGYERKTSPNIDAFARESVAFDHTLAAAPNTPRSMPAVFTGRYASRVSWQKRFANYGALTDENETVFEVFARAGYSTEAQTAHWYWDKATGIKQGVGSWDNRGALSIKDSNTQSAAPDLTPRVVERLQGLRATGKPFVLFAHYFDPHGKYMAHPEVADFGDELMDKYDSEIAFVDRHLKPVFDVLDSPAFREDTVVVLFSDHGEAFKEHGVLFHGRHLFEEEIRATLFIRVPGISARRVEAPVSLIDILPTLADVTGLRAERALGLSLQPLMRGEPGWPADRVVFAEQLPYPNYETHLVAATSATKRKAIRDVTAGRTAVFDLVADPREKANLTASDRDAEPALRAALNAFIEADPGGP